MSLERSILHWLDSVDATAPAPGTPSRPRPSKRRRIDATALPSPDVSLCLPIDEPIPPTVRNEDCRMASSAQRGTPANKRPRDVDDVDDTPRGPSSLKRSHASLSSAASSGVASEEDASSSRKSGTGSASRQLGRMAILDEGFDRASFLGTGCPLPPDLMAVTKSMIAFGKGDGVVPESARACFTKWDGFGFLSDTCFGRDATEFLPFERILAVMKAAEICHVRMHEESSWNQEVHHPLLAAVLRPNGRQELVDFMSCTKARIGKTWTSKNVTARMVDFCIFLDPHDSIGDMVGWSKEDEEEEEGISTDARDPAASNAIDAVLRAWGAVNHTDHEALRRLPVAVSIETKLAENAFTKAELQTGVWHTAHLRMLRGSAAVPRVAANAVAAAMDDAADSGQAKPTYDLGREDWLPGLIIQGHEWTFVATVRAGLRGHGARPVLLSSIQIGSTQTPLGIYSILAAVERLAVWSREAYWPAFRERVLRLHTNQAVTNEVE